jgi:hypothetical protein
MGTERVAAAILLRGILAYASHPACSHFGDAMKASTLCGRKLLLRL